MLNLKNVKKLASLRGGIKGLSFDSKSLKRVLMIGDGRDGDSQDEDDEDPPDSPDPDDDDDDDESSGNGPAPAKKKRRSTSAGPLTVFTISM